MDSVARPDYARGMSPTAPITPEPQITLNHVVVTPENVVLTFQLAGPGSRLGAFLIDLLLRMGFFGAVALIAATVGLFVMSLSMAGLLVVYFVLDWLYFTLCEGFLGGQTPGKKMFGLRVIHEAGYPISGWEAAVRNFVRAMDAAPYLAGGNLSLGVYGVGWLTMLVTGSFRRLGDLAGQTIVVQERRVAVPREPVILSKIEPLPRRELGRWIPPITTLALIEEFLERRLVLDYARGHAMCRDLAQVLSQRLEYKGPRELVERYPMAFVARVYATFHPVEAGDDWRETEPQSAAETARSVPLGTGGSR
jgi:uncharacterized RDD family membrane protein YckC